MNKVLRIDFFSIILDRFSLYEYEHVLHSDLRAPRVA